MKKLLALIFCMPSAFLFSQNFTTENVKKYLDQTYHYIWLLGAVEIKLNADYTYTAEYSSEGLFWYNSGQFKMEKGLIKLLPKTCRAVPDDEAGIDCTSTLGEAKIDLIKDGYSLYYTEYLYVQSKNNKNLLSEGYDNDNFRMPVPGTEVPAGETRMVGNNAVITMGMKKGITTSAVKLRKSPSPQGEEVPYLPGIFEEDQKSVPKDTYVTVVARTTEKMKVKEWENYWYYVQVGTNDGVWMFGEFVKFN